MSTCISVFILIFVSVMKTGQSFCRNVVNLLLKSSRKMSLNVFYHILVCIYKSNSLFTRSLSHLHIKPVFNKIKENEY